MAGRQAAGIPAFGAEAGLGTLSIDCRNLARGVHFLRMRVNGASEGQRCCGSSEIRMDLRSDSAHAFRTLCPSCCPNPTRDSMKWAAALIAVSTTFGFAVRPSRAARTTFGTGRTPGTFFWESFTPYQ